MPSRTSGDSPVQPETGCLKRRDLLKLPIPACAMAAVGGTPLQALIARGSRPIQGDLGLCTYCGIYCGLCDLYQGNAKRHATELSRLLAYYGLGASAFPDVSDSFEDFQRVLGAIEKRLDSVPPCKAGCDLYPGCEIRPCAAERGVDTCAFCDAFPCDKVEKFTEQFNTMPNFLRQKEIGLQAWADEQAALAAEGRSFASQP